MAEHSKSTSKRYHSALKDALAEVERLKAERDKAQTQRDAMFHEIETLRGKTGYCIECEKLKADRDKLREGLAAMEQMVATCLAYEMTIPKFKQWVAEWRAAAGGDSNG